MKHKTNIHEINAKIIKEGWEKRNIRLTGKFVNTQRGKVWYSSFMFIDSKAKIDNSIPTAPVDINGSTYTNAFFAAQILEEQNQIPTNVLKAYDDQLTRLCGGQVIC